MCDEKETIERNPKSYVAWKREAERLRVEIERLQQPINLPAGYRLVPIKPTREQLLAVVQVAGKSAVYTDMVMAAPEHAGFKVEEE
ncbi:MULTISPECIES: hypothetical protein [unclassified Serratia (in: enterobacteria)]|uniref:hypothetical protein n=1 Tax=unclassified Serratia (in: enterobacteria) TaxID=2647522 RepID=UPI000501DCFD|nr:MULTISPECIES: hypothetical protein [unclassified Serratia (in: enterobacteria)]KFK93581.1 hypothetical protein JV45_15680 [Serratia sp. Ag2]KFK93854.1 hypothetical protein IV04_23455 [Serratia sp. Ag1]